MNITVIGLDIAKNVFHACGMSSRGKVLIRKRLYRSEVLEFFANTPECIVAIESCGGSSYWASPRLMHLDKLPTGVKGEMIDRSVEVLGSDLDALILQDIPENESDPGNFTLTIRPDDWMEYVHNKDGYPLVIDGKDYYSSDVRACSLLVTGSSSESGWGTYLTEHKEQLEALAQEMNLVLATGGKDPRNMSEVVNYVFGLDLLHKAGAPVVLTYSEKKKEEYLLEVAMMAKVKDKRCVDMTSCNADEAQIQLERLYESAHTELDPFHLAEDSTLLEEMATVIQDASSGDAGLYHNLHDRARALFQATDILHRVHETPVTRCRSYNTDLMFIAAGVEVPEENWPAIRDAGSVSRIMANLKLADSDGVLDDFQKIKQVILNYPEAPTLMAMAETAQLIAEYPGSNGELTTEDVFRMLLTTGAAKLPDGRHVVISSSASARLFNSAAVSQGDTADSSFAYGALDILLEPARECNVQLGNEKI